MKIRKVKLILGLLLFILPIGMHFAKTATDGSHVVFMMTLIGGYCIIPGRVSFALHSFMWYTSEGRVSYIMKATSLGELRTISWMLGCCPQAVLSLAGFMTIITLYSLIAYIILTFFKSRIITIISDCLMMFCSITSFIAFIYFLDTDWGNYPIDIPVFPVIAFFLSALSLLYTKFPKLREKRKIKKEKIDEEIKTLLCPNCGTQKFSEEFSCRECGL